MTLRRLILIRHGQYEEEDGGTYDLTPLGRRQAEKARRYVEGRNVDRIVSSSMVRARTTAGIIAKGRSITTTKLLAECLPTAVPGYLAEPSELRENRARLDLAYEKFVKPSKKKRTDVLVCHGNVIRYFVCKAIGAPIASWIRLGIHHCSVTEIVVRADGRMALLSYNETGHLPKKMRTMSAAVKALKSR